MSFTLRQKLLAIFCFFLLIASLIGIQSINYFKQLGKSIDVILRENYRSVLACQQMKEALERIDSGTLYEMLGYEIEGGTLVKKNIDLFQTALKIELNNLTLPGEKSLANHLHSQFLLYVQELLMVNTKHQRYPQNYYMETLLPLFQDIKNTADKILHMNQENMNEANNRARMKAARASRYMVIFIVVAFFMALVFMVFSNRWILKPIHRLIHSAQDITDGNLNLMVEVEAMDEIGQLSEAFNIMVTRLRKVRQSDHSRFQRIQQATQESFKNLPEFIAIIDTHGVVEVTTEPARVYFGLTTGKGIAEASYPQLNTLATEVITNKRIASKEYRGELIQHFIDNKERFFQPKAFPMLNTEKELNGLILILEDVTLERESDELKKDLFSTVSHQLKTPLTSIRMAIHLLLEEKIGGLNEKQADLLVTAREDSERLLEIIEDLLDISRIESGHMRMNIEEVSPIDWVSEVVETYKCEARDKGIMLEIELPQHLPGVAADVVQMTHVLGNLITNALQYTPVGGKVTITAKASDEHLYFSVIDTGKGIPKKYQEKIFEKFFRVPGQPEHQGEGLGLSIAKEIVKAHHGNIKVESVEGKGSTFTFSLPLYEH